MFLPYFGNSDCQVVRPFGVACLGIFFPCTTPSETSMFHTVSEGLAPTAIQCLMRSPKNLRSLVSGLYRPTSSTKRPPRGGFFLSVTTTLNAGWFFFPILNNRIVNIVIILLLLLKLFKSFFGCPFFRFLF